MTELPRKIMLALAIHNHQPVGNFGWVFEEGYKKAYLPMLECLERHPTIRIAQHYSGPLRDWLLEFRPDFFPRLRKLVERGQIEMMSGGYYEPVLIALPEADQKGQILKQTDAVEADFGTVPTGLWLAERVWEPHLPRVLAQVGIDYTIVDDSHFKAVGFVDDELLGYYVTEDQGYTLKILPTSMKLRYTIPWASVDEVIDWLREQLEAEGPSGLYAGRQKVAIMGDDGEKFGLWPGTYEHVWRGGWLDEFFEAVAANSDWIETIPPGEFVQQHLSLGRVMLPTASYDEMGEWVLPPERSRQLIHLKHRYRDEGRDDELIFLRGGFWRGFMVKYPEINQLHKKSLWVSEKVHAMQGGKHQFNAFDALWAGQCNCGYWHGVFGGIYLFHIRAADYERLITAENIADGLGRGREPFVEAFQMDFDRDDADDLVITSDQFGLVFDPVRGGTVVEWDYRPARYNLANVITRRREGYHADLEEAAAEGKVVTPDMATDSEELESIHTETVRAREPDLDKLLFYDPYRRATLIDHFLSPDAELDTFYRAEYAEAGDFVEQRYEVETAQPAPGTLTAMLRREGRVSQGGQVTPVMVQKHVTIHAGKPLLHVSYTVANQSGEPLVTRFGVETNWGFAGGENKKNAFMVVGDSAKKHSLAEITAHEVVETLTLEVPLWGLRVSATTSVPAALWRFPLETISNSEAGFERLYQGTTTLLWWPIEVPANGAWHVVLTFEAATL
jgi:alpha-amylase